MPDEAQALVLRDVLADSRGLADLLQGRLSGRRAAVGDGGRASSRRAGRRMTPRGLSHLLVPPHTHPARRLQGVAESGSMCPDCRRRCSCRQGPGWVPALRTGSAT